MASDLISRKALVEKTNDFARKNFGFDDRFEYQLQGMTKALDFIEEAPTVDAVEVVRCKDCVYGSKDSLYESIINCSHIGLNTMRMDFCSYGLKMEEGERNEI